MRKYLNLKYALGFMRYLLTRLRLGSRLQAQGLFYLGRMSRLSVAGQGSIALENKVYFSDLCRVDSLGGQVLIGKDCFFNTNCSIVGMERIEIGEHCLFGPNVCIYDHDHNFGDSALPLAQQGYSSAAVSIGSNVWLGANVVVVRGASSPARSVVAANSTVTRKLSDGPGVYAGSPARLVRAFKP